MKKGQPRIYRLMAADFETAPATSGGADTHVWLWAAHTRCVMGRSEENILAPVEEYNQTTRDFGMETGTSVEGFLEHVVGMAENRVLYVYFHNLGYDVYFLAQCLLRQGAVNLDHWSQAELDKGCEEPCFKTLIGYGESWFELEWYPKGKKAKGDKRTRRPRILFRDSTKHLNHKLSALGEMVGLSKLEMLDEDYSRVRPVGYSPTAEEIAYVKRDVQILSKVLDHIDWKYRTLSTSVWAIFLDNLPVYRTPKRLVKESGCNPRKNFDLWFPELDSIENSILREAYFGGLCRINPKLRAREIQIPGRVYDVNSMYPSVLLEELLPYGEPIYYEEPGLPPEGLWIAHVVVQVSLKRGGVPSIRIKEDRLFSNPDILEADDLELTLTSVDYALYQEMYDIQLLDVSWCCQFRSRKGLFKPYIELFREQKVWNAEGSVARFQAKQYLNRLVGKFGVTPHIMTNTVVLDEDEKIEYRPLYLPKDRGIARNSQGKTHGYLPLAIFVNAYGRAKMARAIRLAGERFVYCDTDSLHVLGDSYVQGLPVHKRAFGRWKLEHRFEEAFYNKPRQYGLRMCYDGVGEPKPDLIQVNGVPHVVLERLQLEDLYESTVFKADVKQVGDDGRIQWVSHEYEYCVEPNDYRFTNRDKVRCMRSIGLLH